jgi:hypothetical protein
MCRGGHLRTWFEQFYQNRGAILVPAGTNVRRRGHGSEGWHSTAGPGIFSDLFEVRRCYFPRNDPRSTLGIPQCSATRISVKNISGNRKLGNAKAKKWRDALHGKS